MSLPALLRRVVALATAVLLAAAGVSGLAPAPASAAATLQEIRDFGDNPGNLQMFLYVPDSVKPKAAVLVVPHWCRGSAAAAFATEFRSFADQYGFLVVYPQSNTADQCFDISSKATLTHGGGGATGSIVAMVRYVQAHYSTDPARVYASGMSSGGMTTNALLGAYPDVFAAGAAFMGVPFGCFAADGVDVWVPDCAQGRIDRTPQQWGDLVRAAYPGYSGPRPRFQFWHGPGDTILAYQNFTEEIDQWTDVLHVGPQPTTVDEPQPGWHRQQFADARGVVRVEAISVDGAAHDLPNKPGQVALAISFLGLDKDPSPGTGGGRPVADTFEDGLWPGWTAPAGVTLAAGTPGAGGSTTALVATAPQPLRRGPVRIVAPASLKKGRWYTATASVRAGEGARPAGFTIGVTGGTSVTATAREARGKAWAKPVTSFRWGGGGPVRLTVRYTRACPGDAAPREIRVDSVVLRAVAAEPEAPAPVSCR